MNDPTPQAHFEVALALLERQGQWLIQLRDDLAWIVAPGTWGLFGGHLEPGETPEQALRRELLEEIGWQAGELALCHRHVTPRRTAHFFCGPLTVPLQRLQLREGQDMRLAGLREMETGAVWSARLGAHRPLAPSLQRAVALLLEGQPDSEDARATHGVHHLTAGLDGSEHRFPFPFDGRSVRMVLELQTGRRQHLLAGGDGVGQLHAHADRHHAEIHDHLHRSHQRPGTSFQLR